MVSTLPFGGKLRWRKRNGGERSWAGVFCQSEQLIIEAQCLQSSMLNAIGKCCEYIPICW